MKKTLKAMVLCACVAGIATGNVFAAAVGEAAPQETQATMEEPISTAGTFEATLDNEYFAAKGAEVTALREAGDEAAALAAAKEMYETIGLESDSDLYPVCELIIEIKQAQPMAAEQDPAQIVQAVEERLAMDRVSYDDWNKLTYAEKLLVAAYPTVAYDVNKCRNWASSTTDSYYGHGGSGDNSDAFRHAYWNALMSLQIGDFYAEMFANAHEQKSDYYMNYTMKCGYSGWTHTKMDLYNNQMGRDCVSPVTTTAQGAMNNILQAIKDHKHYYLHANQDCNPDSVE